MELDGAVAVLTGAALGIGPVVAEHLARAGVRLAIVARAEDDPRATQRRLTGYDTFVVPADLTDDDERERVVRVVREVLGPPTLLVTNPAAAHVAHFRDVTAGDVRRVIGLDLIATQALTARLLPDMLAAGRGHIVTIGSVAGRTGYPYGVLDSAAKHGVVGFTRALREELRGTGVGVSVVHPTLVAETDAPGGRPRALGRVGPEDVAAAVLRCVRRDRAEITVAPPVARIANAVSALSPRLASWVGRRGGVHDYLRAIADRHR
ncbi:SDR family NAD(P)-dependent oxidoreductase [Actinokineospora auranticolor]|uniref:Short-subunit dehydrogenase n=1 Tax=Actinokineospora auranticolor TaxID=155976 RepID=A0A2S6GJU7_9PSEU|nr:SDR family NAD(P)-dependent oxidoreductase [Actinokineospora auranticolor]PPK65485.1 short-subunit dehydrogenase [Actinokineospora auranticolor]